PKGKQPLGQGARANGSAPDLWTLPRVGRVIERLPGVLYHPGQVWKILRALDWSLQRPAKQARQRKRKKVRRWLTQTWPEIKKKLAAARPGSSSKTRAASRNVPPSAGPGLPKAKPRS